MRRAIRSIVVVVLAGFAACNDDNPCGLVPPSTTSLDVDVSKAPNEACTLVISNGTTTTSFSVGAAGPSPSDAGFIAGLCLGDAGTMVSVTPDAGGLIAKRTATELCIEQTALMASFYASTNSCDVTVTLTCGGITVVDGQPWRVCNIGC